MKGIGGVCYPGHTKQGNQILGNIRTGGSETFKLHQHHEACWGHWPDNSGPSTGLERLNTDTFVVGLQSDGDLLHVVRSTDVPGHRSDNLYREISFLFLKTDYLTICVSEMMVTAWVWKFKGFAFYYIYILFSVTGREKEQKKISVTLKKLWKAKSEAKFTVVPRLLLQHAGSVLPALHHETDLSLHLAMKVWYSAHGSIATSGHWDTTQLTGQNFPGLNFN